jgi:hypothetical protein
MIRDMIGMACLFGGLLAEQNEVVLLGSWPEAIRAVSATGIRLQTEQGERTLRVGPLQGLDLQEALDLRGQRRQHGFEVDREQAEGLHAHRAGIVQRGYYRAGLAPDIPAGVM